MEIITVTGKDGAGKTPLISDIYDELKNIGKVEIPMKIEGKDKRDFKALVVYNNKRIAFCSIGDPADANHILIEYVLRGIIFASKNTADILINAYRIEDNDFSQFKEFPKQLFEKLLGDTVIITEKKLDNNSDEIKNFIRSKLK